MNMNYKIETTWAVDSCGVYSYHINDGKLNFKQSLIGSIQYDGNEVYSIVMADNQRINGYTSHRQAQQALESIHRISKYGK